MRLIDLHTNWLLQYAAETSLFDPAAAKPIAKRLRRLGGYLTDTAIAFLVATTSPAIANAHPDRWQALDNLLTRYEAEFSGRLLIDPSDLTLYRSEPSDALTWGVLTVCGLDTLIREPSDLDRLSALHRRGVRVFQLASSAKTHIGGSDNSADPRPLTTLGILCLERITEIAAKQPGNPRLVIDLANLNPSTIVAILDWLAADPSRPNLLIPINSHGLGSDFNTPRSTPDIWDIATKLLSLGGLIAIDPDAFAFTSPDQFAATLGRLLSLQANAGIALSTNYLSLDQVTPTLDNAERLIHWATRSFDAEVAQQLVFRNADRLLERMARISD